MVSIRLYADKKMKVDLLSIYKNDLDIRAKDCSLRISFGKDYDAIDNFYRSIEKWYNHTKERRKRLHGQQGKKE